MARGWIVSLAVLAIVALAPGCRSRRGRPSEVVSCSPGATVMVACGSGCGLGACSGDATLTVCEGTSSEDACASGIGQIGFNDDGCGSLCPGLSVTCPSSGTIRVVPMGYMGRDFQCEWDTQ